MPKIKKDIKVPTPVKDETRVKLLRATLYKDHMLYIRRVGEDFFEYLLEFNGEIYSGYNIFTPREGEDKIKPSDEGMLSDYVTAMGETTCDALIEKEKTKLKAEEVKDAPSV